MAPSGPGARRKFRGPGCSTFVVRRVAGWSFFFLPHMVFGCLLGCVVSFWELVLLPEKNTQLILPKFPEGVFFFQRPWCVPTSPSTCSSAQWPEAFISGLSDMRRGVAMCSAALPMKAMGWIQSFFKSLGPEKPIGSRALGPSRESREHLNV